jgi:glycosyltransferase involved in cell wall biosynthesis
MGVSQGRRMSMMIINIPIEPIESRYSADWDKWFIAELNERKYNFSTVMGTPLSNKIREGAFLDVISTNKFKADQISQICSAVDQGFIPRTERVVFIIQDGWFPVEQLAYMRDMLGCHEWKFVGIFHDGTYDKWDVTARNNMYVWGEDLENAWFKIYDRIIVASNFHYDILLSTRKVDSRRISVIPWKVEVPIVFQEIQQKKENIIVWPHRLNDDKQPDLFFRIADELRHPDWQWIRTRDQELNKFQYYELLSKSKIAVSTALLEMFGIAMVEAVLLGCIPLVPDRLSYKDMYSRCFRYQGESEFKEKLEKFCKGDIPFDQLKYIKDNFIDNSKQFFNNLFDVVEEL